MKRLIFLSFLTLVWLQANIDFSYEMKYGNGSSTEYGNEYFENLLDVNAYFNDNVTLYTQLEYSVPPLFGESQTAVQKIILEYFQDNLTVSAGDLYELYGYGLAVNMSQDQSIGFDNSLRGLSWRYDLSDPVLFGFIDGVSLFGLIGKGPYNYALNASTGLNTRRMENLLGAVGFSYYGDIIPGELSFWQVEQESYLPLDVVLQYHSAEQLTWLEEDFVSSISAEDVTEDTVKAVSREVSYATSIGFVDIYIEKMWSDYSKLLGGSVFGSMLYSSVYASLGGWGLTWDYKDYDMPYYIPSVSNPPTVFREASSTLIGRISHNTLFNDETGHQFEVNRSFSEHLNFLGNLSFSRRQRGAVEQNQFELTHEFEVDTLMFDWTPVSENLVFLSNPDFTEMALFDLDESLYAFYPYQEVYGEFSGYILDEKLYWLIGFDKINDITKYHHQKTESFNNNGLTGSAMEDLVVQEYENYWWGVWNENYQPPLVDSLTADLIFEATHGTSVENKISETAAAGLADAQAFSVRGNSIENSYNLIEAVTIPTNFAWNMGQGHSLTLYFDQQWKTEEWNRSVIDETSGAADNTTSAEINTYSIYGSLTQRLFGKYSFTFLYDYEDVENKTAVGKTTSSDEWLGYEFAWDINHQSQISIFFGSIKGGRICANGICAEQPDFDDGIRVTFRSIF